MQLFFIYITCDIYIYIYDKKFNLKYKISLFIYIKVNEKIIIILL